MRTTTGKPATSATPIERPAALSVLALERIRADIISNVFAFGERLTEEGLSTYYGLTRAPIRTALQNLQAEGLVQIQAQKGAFVFDPTPEEVQSLCELRTALELGACRLAMARHPAALQEALEAILAQMRPLADRVVDPAYQELDTAFHAAILASAASPMLERTYAQSVQPLFAALRSRLARDVIHAERSYEEHRRIADFVARGDLPGLLEAVETHIRITNHYYARLLQAAQSQR